MEGSSRFVNSHDMLAYLIDVAARRGDPKDNEKRQKNQDILLRDFVENIVLCRAEQETWDAMTKFTRLYMMTYSPIMHEARFLPFDALSTPLKKQVCSWLAAQHILQGDDQVKGDFFEHLSPWPLYQRCRDIMNNDSAFCVSRLQEVGKEPHGVHSTELHGQPAPDLQARDQRRGHGVCEGVKAD